MFQKGNQFWKLAENIGRDKIFASPEEMAIPIKEYIEMVISNPITVETATSRGAVSIRKPRPLTIKGLCNHLGIAHKTWLEYKKRDDFSKLITQVEDLVYDQKYTYAAIGEFNSNIIARDLGLTDKQETDVNLSKPLQIVKQYDSDSDSSNNS